MTVKQQSTPAGDGPDRRAAMESFSKAGRAELQQAWDAIEAKRHGRQPPPASTSSQWSEEKTDERTA